jgi:hypothetical protein
MPAIRRISRFVPPCGGARSSKAAQHGAQPIGAGSALLVHRGAAGGAQFVGLRIRALLLGGGAGVADQAAGGGCAGFGRHGPVSGEFRGVCANVEVIRKRPFAQVAGTGSAPGWRHPPGRGRGGDHPGRWRLEIPRYPGASKPRNRSRRRTASTPTDGQHEDAAALCAGPGGFRPLAVGGHRWSILVRAYDLVDDSVDGRRVREAG